MNEGNNKAFCSADYCRELKAKNEELQDKHWSECRQIAHYEDELSKYQKEMPKIVEYIDYLRSLPANRWISVKDRLPENNVEVMLYDTDCGIVFGWYDDEIEDFVAEFISPLDAVTHWQPLPEPPKDGDING